MADAKKDLVDQWVIKAEHDMASAKRLLDGDPPYLDTAVYHCQQAAEKALKAYLTQKDRPVQKVHDLSLLVSECAGLDETFEDLEASAENLTPYGVAFRYPGGALEPQAEEAAEAVKFAQQVLDFVKRKLYGSGRE